MTDDALDQLRRAAQRAVHRSQLRVSVDPRAILTLFRKCDEAVKPKEPIEHGHRREDNGRTYRHRHPRGDVPHGHPGATYDSRPEIKL